MQYAPDRAADRGTVGGLGWWLSITDLNPCSRNTDNGILQAALKAMPGNAQQDFEVC